MAKLTVLLVLPLAVFAVACDGGGDSNDDGAPDSAETPTVEEVADGPDTPMPGVGAVDGSCTPALAHDTGTFLDETLATADGRDRGYILHVPPSYTGDAAAPLVMNFHGFALTDDLYSDYTAMHTKADEAGFVVVTPQGTNVGGDGPPHWNLGAPDEVEPDDIAFVDELIDALTAELCIDPARVYATGFSNGAGLSVRLACDLPDRIAAIAPVAGVFFPPSGCDATRPVPVLAFHGTEDALVPFEGGSSGGGALGRGHVADDIILAWADHNGCTSLVEENPLVGTAGVRLVRHDGCDDGATVELYVIEDADPETEGAQGGGHTWPDASWGEPTDEGNATTRELNANDVIWDFFEAHPLP